SGEKIYPLYQMLIDTKSYCFMDKSNYLSIKRRVDLPWIDRYVPVTVHSEEHESLDTLPPLHKVEKDRPLQIGGTNISAYNLPRSNISSELECVIDKTILLASIRSPTR
ncbi:MAG: hypothetical protein K5739_06855, partial [Lachnospiraceae bacterium]|nr:hypothetical protein [Lachnospiraceae bacterium]